MDFVRSLKQKQQGRATVRVPGGLGGVEGVRTNMYYSEDLDLDLALADNVLWSGLIWSDLSK